MKFRVPHSSFLIVASMVLIVLTVRSVDAQQKCSVKLADAPAVRGFRLGMTSEQVQKMLGPLGTERKLARELVTRQDPFGRSSVSFRPWEGVSADLSGISRVELEFVDARLSKFTLRYLRQGGLSMEEFIGKVSQATGLPNEWSDRWDGMRIVLVDIRRALECDGFNVKAEELSIYLELTFEDTVAARLVLARKAAKDKKDRDAFKP